MTYGYTRSKEGNEITGETDRLRYSALNLWLSSKSAYRKRYYEGQSVSTPEMIFGHKVHTMMEDKKAVTAHPFLSQLPRYPVSEKNIELTVDGVKIGGCIDSFDPDTFSFLDYKSSHLSKDGKVPWNVVKVAKHMQLVFYSLLVREKFGKVDPNVLLVWIGTEFVKKSQEFAGHVLEAESRELALTGQFEVFKRRVAKWETDALKKIIKKAAEDISIDFIQYKATV